MRCNWNRSGPEAFRRSRPSLDHFNVAIARRGVRDQGMEQFVRSRRHPIDCQIESLFVGFRRFGEPAQFTDELER
jgi:hypothetical protein